MKIKVLYEENIINGKANYTDIEIPDGDYITILEKEYQQRLEAASDEDKHKVKRCGTMQEMFDILNKKTYNSWRNYRIHTSGTATPKRADGKKSSAKLCDTNHDVNEQNTIECFGYNSAFDEIERKNEYEHMCGWLRKKLKPEQAELLIAVYLNDVPKQDYAAKLGISPSAVSHRLKTAKKILKKFLPVQVGK